MNANNKIKTLDENKKNLIKINFLNCFNKLSLPVLFFLFLAPLFFSCGCDAKNGMKGRTFSTPGPVAGSPWVVGTSPVGEPADQVYDVLIVRSQPSLRFSGWKGELELKGAEAVLYRLGINYALINEEELYKGELPCKVLLLPNTRCMNLKACEGIRLYSKSGGKIFATYMSSYRDENNEKINNENNFALADLFGGDFLQWVSGKPNCEYLYMGEVGKRVQLGRNQAMLIKKGKDTQSLALWQDEDKVTRTLGNQPLSSIIYNPATHTVYCGEDLFAPENSESPEVLEVIATLLDMLEPGIVKKQPSQDKIKPTMTIPPEILQGMKPQGESVQIGITGKFTNINVVCDKDITLTSTVEMVQTKILPSSEVEYNKVESLGIPGGTLLKLEVVSVVDKEPYCRVYSQRDNKLIAQAWGNIIISSKDSYPVKIIDMKDNGTYSYLAFRGELKFSIGYGNMSLINTLTMDEYIAGVVPGEVPATFPPESLKAMSVVARTFAYSTMGKHKGEGFHLCDGVHCQVYKGVMGERVETNNAVSETSGIIAESGGKPVMAVFHSTCGGTLADARSVWKNSDPNLLQGSDTLQPFEEDLSSENALRSFIDNPPDCYCKKSGRFRWQQSYTKEQFKKLLGESLGYMNGGRSLEIRQIHSMTVTRRSTDGRVQNLEIVTDVGTFNIEKDKIRWLTSGGKVGTAGLSSTLFYIREDDEGYCWVGGGWGHGVGMCQEGAKGMALEGHGYKEIMDHYYKDIQLVKKY